MRITLDFTDDDFGRLSTGSDMWRSRWDSTWRVRTENGDFRTAPMGGAAALKSSWLVIYYAGSDWLTVKYMCGYLAAQGAPHELAWMTYEDLGEYVILTSYLTESWKGKISLIPH